MMNTLNLRLDIRDLLADEVDTLSSWTSDFDIDRLTDQVRKRRSEEHEFLVVRLDNGRAIGRAEIDYAERAGAGSVGAVEVHPDLRSLGIGTVLIDAAERRIERRGIRIAAIDVEIHNVRARALYERLGYVMSEREDQAWDQQAPDGTVYRYETVCVVLHKELRPAD